MYKMAEVNGEIYIDIQRTMAWRFAGLTSYCRYVYYAFNMHLTLITDYLKLIKVLRRCIM